MVVRVSSMKVIREDWFLSHLRYLKTKLIRSFNAIEKWDYLTLRPSECGIWYSLEYRYKKKNRNIKKHALAGYHIPWLWQWAACAATCKNNLANFWKEGDTFLNHIVTGDELWCHYHIPTSKQSSLTWKHKNMGHATKTRSKYQPEKWHWHFFWHFLICIGYADTLMKLHTNIKNCWEGRLSARIMR